MYSTGRGFVPPVGRSLYDKLVEQLKLAGQPVPEPEPTDVAVPAAPGLPASWDDIAVGHMVIADEGQPWCAAIVLARDGDMLTLKWRDYPRSQTCCGTPVSVALLKPGPVSRLTVRHHSSGRVLRPEHLSPHTNPLIEANHESHHRTHSRAQ